MLKHDRNGRLYEVEAGYAHRVHDANAMLDADAELDTQADKLETEAMLRYQAEYATLFELGFALGGVRV